MKFNQYAEFSKLLETNSITLEDWKKDPTVKLVKEADENDQSLDTKKGNIITKKGRMRKALNSQAKKLQEQINKNLVQKYIDPIFEQKTGVYKKMAQLLTQKQPKEVVNELSGELKNLRSQVSKQLGLIEKASDTFIQNYTTKIEGALSKKGLKEGTVIDLKTYWTLLTTQIKLQLLQSITKKDEELLDSIIKDPKIKKIALEIAKKINVGVNDKVTGLSGSIKEQKTKILDSDKKAEGSQSSNKKSEETPVELN